MKLPTIAGEGRLAADPILRFTKSGQPALSMRLVFNDTRYNTATQNYDQFGEPLWLDVVYYKIDAEQLNEQAKKGDLVFVSGELRDRSYETTSGEKRNKMEIRADVLAVRQNSKRRTETPATTPAAPLTDPFAVGATDAPF